MTVAKWPVRKEQAKAAVRRSDADLGARRRGFEQTDQSLSHMRRSFVVQASGGSNGFHAPEIQRIAGAHIFGMAPSASHPDATHSRSMIPCQVQS